jgi:predicted nucleic acid-binding protein
MARPDLVLVDTSAAVAFLVSDHSAHDRTWEALAERRLGMAGHAWFETFSVLTRLPGPSRRDPATVTELLRVNFSDSRFLSEAASAGLTASLSEAGVSGGAVYDALVAATATEHNLRLVSRDRRALDTYRALGADVELLG